MSALILLLLWIVVPEAWAVLAPVFGFGAIISLVFLLVDFGRMFLFRAPYELYREQHEALRAALPASIAETRRHELHAALAAFLSQGQELSMQLEHFLNNARGPRRPIHNDMDIGYQAIEWINQVEAYIGQELDHSYHVRFGRDAYFPPLETLGMERSVIRPGLRARVANLSGIVDEFRSGH
jgi:hypothetical protein